MVAHLSLFSGIGAIDLGLRLAEPRLRTVGYVERDAFAAAVLVARMEDQALDQAPIWDDLATFPSRLYSGKVDLISAGFPCQPFSAAGKRRGKADDRWLWPLIANTIQATQPRRVFLENVPGVIRHGLADILRDLAEGGYDAEWGLFRADTHAGAPHRRQRFFLLADADSEQLRHEPGRGSGTYGKGAPVLEHTSRPVADADGNGNGQQGQRGGGVFQREERHADGRHGTGVFPPGPDDTDAWQGYEGPQPAVCRDADGAAYRVDRLRALGNAAVPQCVAAAYQELSGT